jgi:hypothetical protein
MKKEIFLKTLLLLLIMILTVDSLTAGNNPFLRPTNNINLNLFGDASIFSVNYEKLFINNRQFFLAWKIGAGYSESLGLPDDNTSLLSTPVHLTGNYGERKHYFEFGLGASLLFYDSMKFWDYALYPIIGYRLQPYKKDKFSFRIFASYPLTDKIDMKDYWFFPVGISVGFCF